MLFFGLKVSSHQETEFSLSIICQNHHNGLKHCKNHYLDLFYSLKFESLFPYE